MFSIVTALLARWLCDRLLRCSSRVRSPHAVVPGLAVCVCDFSVCKRSHDTGIIPSGAAFFLPSQELAYRETCWPQQKICQGMVSLSSHQGLRCPKFCKETDQIVPDD